MASTRGARTLHVFIDEDIPRVVSHFYCPEKILESLYETAIIGTNSVNRELAQRVRYALEKGSVKVVHCFNQASKDTALSRYESLMVHVASDCGLYPFKTGFEWAEFFIRFFNINLYQDYDELMKHKNK
jgi:hypothetical protein